MCGPRFLGTPRLVRRNLWLHLTFLGLFNLYLTPSRFLHFNLSFSRLLRLLRLLRLHFAFGGRLLNHNLSLGRLFNLNVSLSRLPNLNPFSRLLLNWRINRRSRLNRLLFDWSLLNRRRLKVHVWNIPIARNPLELNLFPNRPLFGSEEETDGVLFRGGKTRPHPDREGSEGAVVSDAAADEWSLFEVFLEGDALENGGFVLDGVVDLLGDL